MDGRKPTGAAWPLVTAGRTCLCNTWSACWACPGIVKKKDAAAQTTAARPDGILGENNCRFLPTPRFSRILTPQGSYLLAPTFDSKEPLPLYSLKSQLTKSTSGDC